MKYPILFCVMLLSVICYSQSAAQLPIYRVVEVMPQFPGGKVAMDSFITHTLKYPRIAREKQETGRVVIECVVDTDGLLTDIAVKTSVIQRLDDEALRIVNLMPDFSPGKLKGKPVRVIQNIPVEFVLPKD
jgi:protein TonB